MFDLSDLTEPVLRSECRQVGGHLYIRSHAGLDTSTWNAGGKHLSVVFVMGGEGTRLKHLTGDEGSKHMLDIKGKPLCRHSFDMWLSSGFSHFRMLIDGSPGGRSIQGYFGSERDGATIEYHVERSRLGTGGALQEAILSGTIEGSFIMHYPDDAVLGYPGFPGDFQKVATAAMAAGHQVVIVCVPGTVYQWGEAPDDGVKVTDFIEKPFVRKDSYTGICAVHHSALDLIRGLDTGSYAKLERTVFKDIARRGKMYKVLIPTEYWFPVNDLPGLKRFEQAVGM
jgi:NDP-sugar pyrophosphorylase family protein